MFNLFLFKIFRVDPVLHWILTDIVSSIRSSFKQKFSAMGIWDSLGHLLGVKQGRFPVTFKNIKHTAYGTQLLILSHSVTWNKVLNEGKVLVDEMTTLINYYRENEDYRTPAISHYTEKFKEGKKIRQAPDFKFSAQDVVRSLGNIYHDLLQPQNWHSQKSELVPIIC